MIQLMNKTLSSGSNSIMFQTTYEKSNQYMSVAHTLKPSSRDGGGRRNLKSLMTTKR